MKILCQKAELLNGLNIVSKAVPGKTTMSILECILIDSSNGKISLTANDMELGIETVVEGQIIEKGTVALDAKLLLDIVRKLNDSIINIESDEDYKTIITCENAKFNIQGKSGEEFSYLPQVEKNDPLIISQLSLKDIIRQTIFSIADNDSNKIMCGEYLEINNNKLRLTSLDGHRISIRNIELSDSYSDKKVIIPGKTLNEISKIISGNAEDDIYIYFTDKHVVFEFDNTTVISRIIEGEYFKVNQMLNSNFETKVSINKKELLNCIDRATLLVKEGDKKPIIVEIGDDHIELKINSAIGSMNENIDIKKEGKNLAIGFNPKFLIDALKVIDDESIDLYLVNSKAPCFIKDEKGSFVYLILPVNFASVG